LGVKLILGRLRPPQSKYIQPIWKLSKRYGKSFIKPNERVSEKALSGIFFAIAIICRAFGDTPNNVLRESYEASGQLLEAQLVSRGVGVDERFHGRALFASDLFPSV
jgi:hypothetical protein